MHAGRIRGYGWSESCGSDGFHVEVPIDFGMPVVVAAAAAVTQQVKLTLVFFPLAGSASGCPA
jgi:hypothetical protein